MASPTPPGLPYFGLLDSARREGHADIALALGHHVHFGYWPAPVDGDVSAAEFARAAERLSLLVAELGGIRDGQRIADVGCGFGGTLATLDRHYRRMELGGFNIEERQLAVARQRIRAEDSNHLYFERADAGHLPIADGTLDRMLAIECIFHFPSRHRFFEEAVRTLVPGGRLVVVDFVPSPLIAPAMRFGAPFFARLHGGVDVACTAAHYRELARRVGLVPILEYDMTRNTLPSYRFIRRVMMDRYRSGFDRLLLGIANHSSELYARQGLLRYVSMIFERPKIRRDRA